MLGQGLRSGCGAARRGLSTSAVAQQAVPALAGTQSSGGWLSKLFGGGGKGRISTPLTEPLEGVNQPLADPPRTQPPHTEVSTLGNGLKVASEDTPGPTVSLGLYVNAGSANETERNTGTCHLLESMAFKATQHRTHFRLVREVENIGASTVASASREQLVYIIDASKAVGAEALEILTDAVLNPKFANNDVKAAAAKLEEDVKTLADNPQSLLLEGLHSVAYHGGLARPLIAPPGAASRLTGDDLAQFVSEHFTGASMALAGAGVEHEELVQLARPLLEAVPQGQPRKAPPSSYVGGDFRTAAPSPESHALLAFEVPGGWHDMKTSIATTVLQFLLGGGGSFSSGGPGKGMHSRLYTRVLNQHHWVHNASAFSSVYDRTGLAGIHITTESGKIEQGVDIACKELQSLTKDVPAAELERAKRAALGTVLSSLEGRAIVAEDIGRQLLTYGHRKPVPEFTKALDEITAGDITKLVTNMLKAPPSFAGSGNISAMPRYDALLRRFS